MTDYRDARLAFVELGETTMRRVLAAAVVSAGGTLRIREDAMAQVEAGEWTFAVVEEPQGRVTHLVAKHCTDDHEQRPEATMAYTFDGRQYHLRVLRAGAGVLVAFTCPRCSRASSLPHQIHRKDPDGVSARRPLPFLIAASVAPDIDMRGDLATIVCGHEGCNFHASLENGVLTQLGDWR